MIIYDKNGSPLHDILLSDDSNHTAELMGDDLLNLRFQVAEVLEIPLRSFCVFEGRRYILFMPPTITKRHERAFEYVMPMYTNAYALKTTLLRNTVDGRLSFPYTATAREHLALLVDNLNAAERNTLWAVDTNKTEDTEERLVNYDFNYCLDALKAIAETFGTEYEIEEVANESGAPSYRISIHEVEYHKSTPLKMRYGKDNGFISGTARKNNNDLPPIDRLYIQGGEQNIPAHYGQTPNGDGTYSTNDEEAASTTLLLPKDTLAIIDGRRFYFAQAIGNRRRTDESGNTYVQQMNDTTPEILYDEDGNVTTAQPFRSALCFLTSEDGRSLERVRHTYYDPNYQARGTNVEGYYDASEIYPMRIGGVSQVRKITRTRLNDSGTLETYHLYNIIDALPDCPDYSQLTADGEKMTVTFQDGILAGREFDLNTTSDGNVICRQVTVYDSDGRPIQAQEMELCPSDQDGVTMPSETFEPAVGNHYITFHCRLPQEYISGIAYGAEFRALKEMAIHMRDNGQESYTFEGSVQGIWAKRVWDEVVPDYEEQGTHYNEYFNIGQHIKITDSHLFGAEGIVLRVIGVRKPINNPHAIELVLSNAKILQYDWVSQLSQTVRAVRLRPRQLRPHNPLYPMNFSRVVEILDTDANPNPDGTIPDLRRRSVIPFTKYTLAVNKVNEIVGSLNRANTIFSTIATKYDGFLMAIKDKAIITDNERKQYIIGTEICVTDKTGQEVCHIDNPDMDVPEDLKP